MPTYGDIVALAEQREIDFQRRTAAGANAAAEILGVDADGGRCATLYGMLRRGPRA